MNDRIQKIISLFLKEPDITITEMMQKLSLTRRQVNYAIGLINEQLRKNNYSTIQRHRNGKFSYPTELKNLLFNLQKTSLLGNYSDTDRQIMIILYLITNKGYVSLDHLTTLLNYSKTTILSDIKVAAKIVKKYNLKITYNRTKGYSLIGDEDEIYHLATNLILRNSAILTNNVMDKLVNDTDILKKSILIILDLENQFKMTFSDKYFEALKILIQIIYFRGLNNKKQLKHEPDPFIANTTEYKYLRSLDLLKNLNANSIQWIALEILSANVYDKSNLTLSPEEIQIKKFVHQMVNSFEAKTLVKVQDKDSFEHRLLNHLRPACYRVKYHLFVIDHIDIENSKDHKVLMKIMRELIQPLERWIGQKFPKYEIQLLTYYFGYQLVNSFSSVNSIVPKYKAVVVCSNGIMMSRILIQDLRKLFPEFNFLFTLSAREFEKSKQEFDVVFTTVPLETILPQYIVKINMNYSESIGLRYRVLNDLGLERTDSQVENLIKLVSKYAEISDSNSLRHDMEKLLISNNASNIEKNNKNKFPNLLEFIKPKYIQVIDQPIIEWKTALATALQPLISDKKVTNKYLKELQTQIDTPYNYSFLGQYMAIPHAMPEKGVIDDGISMLISKSPILLPYGKQTRILTPIAFYHLNKSKKAINQLAELATDEQVVMKLLEAKNSSSAYKIIKEYIEERI